MPELLRAGKPVFIEKPLASSVQTGRRILEAVEQSGTFIMVGHHKRSDAATAYARKRIEELAESGEIVDQTNARITMPAGDWVAGGFEGRIDEVAIFNRALTKEEVQAQFEASGLGKTN